MSKRELEQTSETVVSESKRPKLEDDVSTTNASSNIASQPDIAKSNGNSTTRPPKENEERKSLAPKKKIAMVVGYKGTNFHGNQIQPDEATVEGVLWEALKQTKAVMESNKKDPRKIGWSRTSRTDRGVHALVNLVECKLHAYEELVPELNELLKNKDGENDVMVHGYSRVTGSFKARVTCDAREYWYLLPTFVFNRKDQVLSYLEDSPKNIELLDQRMFEIPIEELNQRVDPSYRMSEEDRTFVNDIMKKFHGTHFFHNFTKLSKEVTMNQTQRFITKFEVQEPFIDEKSGLEWAVVHIYGASFLINQIRKMIGMVIALCKGKIDLSAMDTIFERDVEQFVPRVPGNGLMLKDMKFDTYNNYKSETHGQLHPYDDFIDQIEIFKKQLFAHIIQMENNNQEWRRWVYLVDKIIKTRKDPMDSEKASSRKKGEIVEVEIDINAPLDKVWDIVGSFEKMPQTIDGVKLIEIENDKLPNEIGVIRRVHVPSAKDPKRLVIKRHILKRLDQENHEIEFETAAIKTFTENSVVTSVIKLIEKSSTLVTVTWKMEIDIGTETFLATLKNETEKHLFNLKKSLETI